MRPYFFEKIIANKKVVSSSFYRRIFGFKFKKELDLYCISEQPTLMYHSVGCNIVGGSSINDIKSHIEKIRYAFSMNNLDLKKSIVITFDDGYKSSIPAIKMLLANGFRVIIFYPINLKGFRFLPKDCIRVVLSRVKKGSIIKIGDFTIRVLFNSQEYRRYISIVLNRKLMNTMCRQQYLAEISRFCVEHENSLHENCLEHELMSFEDIINIKRLSNQFTVGTHGRSHYRFDRITDSVEIELEIIETKYEIEKKTNMVVNSIAYPYGIYNSIIEKKAVCLYENVYRVKKCYTNYPEKSIPRDSLDGISVKTVHVLKSQEFSFNENY